MEMTVDNLSQEDLIRKVLENQDESLANDERILELLEDLFERVNNLDISGEGFEVS